MSSEWRTVSLSGVAELSMGETLLSKNLTGDGIPVLIGASLHGGNGGTVSATMKNGTLGGNVKLFNSGSVDAGFECHLLERDLEPSLHPGRRRPRGAALEHEPCRCLSQG